MSRQCCPECEDHPILDETLGCIFCGGRYVWKTKLDDKDSQYEQ